MSIKIVILLALAVCCSSHEDDREKTLFPCYDAAGTFLGHICTAPMPQATLVNLCKQKRYSTTETVGPSTDIPC